MRALWIVGFWFVAAAFAWVVGSRWVDRSRSRGRLGYREEDLEEAMEAETAAGGEDLARGLFGLRLWLVQSGFRQRNAPQVFVATAISCLIGGGLTAYGIISSGSVEQGLSLVGALPGATGDLIMFVLVATPWLSWLLIASAPWVYVRAKRRARVASVEQDMPITLELLATLGGAGIGLDASISKLIDSPGDERALREELRLYRFEVMTGVPRIQCLRRLSRRKAATT